LQGIEEENSSIPCKSHALHHAVSQRGGGKKRLQTAVQNRFKRRFGNIKNGEKYTEEQIKTIRELLMFLAQIEYELNKI
jgi:ribosomal protein L44E